MERSGWDVTDSLRSAARIRFVRPLCHGLSSSFGLQAVLRPHAASQNGLKTELRTDVFTTNLHLQSQPLLVEVKTLNREFVLSAMQHLLRHRNNETIRPHRPQTAANPRDAINVHAMLRIGHTLRQEIVDPKASQRLVRRPPKQTTARVGQARPEKRISHDLVTFRYFVHDHRVKSPTLRIRRQRVESGFIREVGAGGVDRSVGYAPMG